jgi:hypothetical protein
MTATNPGVPDPNAGGMPANILQSIKLRIEYLEHALQMTQGTVVEDIYEARAYLRTLEKDFAAKFSGVDRLGNLLPVAESPTE